KISYNLIDKKTGKIIENPADVENTTEVAITAAKAEATQSLKNSWANKAFNAISKAYKDFDEMQLY
ncbi:MAG TPA: hypothetical protein VN626_03525, partial [Clostridia bacterium]|nr:hypothetical protein [Clostridia bacterium]